jgi:putative GTP pyrophosphokinase
MELIEIKKEFQKNISLYDNLGKNVLESLRILLENENIKVLSIYYRIKETDSFMEKNERKSYDNPLIEIEDICGIRIICYYQKDITRIIEIIKNEFTIHESQNKETKLGFDQFGYRSHHIIASIKKEWEKTPNFRGLLNLKCEIQVRTILMHAWAEIEHSLAYKNEAQTPTQFRRKLHRISAKLEEADEQFEELKKESQEYQNSLINKTKNKQPVIYESLELNIDSLQAFMDNNYPKRKRNLEQTGTLLNNMIEYDISLNDLKKSWDILSPKFKEFEKEYWANNTTISNWSQAGVVRISLDMTIERFRNRHKSISKKSEIEKYVKKYFA